MSRTHEASPRDGAPDDTSHPQAPTRVWPGRLARAASGLVVLGVVGVVVVLGGPAAPGDVRSVPSQALEVPPATTTLVCPGPLVLPDDTGRGGSAFDPTPVDPVTSVSAVTSLPGDVSPTGAVTALDPKDVRADLDPGGGAGSVSGAGATVGTVDGPLVVHAQPGRTAARAGAVGSAVVTAGDLRGLAAASCGRPVADAWVVGGATDLTSTADLALVNAGTTPADVTLQVWGPSGPVDLGGERYLVAPGAQRLVSLGGVAAEQRRVALHVSATGGRVAVHLQDSAVDGYTPAGTDLVVPGTEPALRQVLPGVSVVASDVDDAHGPALRLLVPGDTGTTARVTLLGPDGPTDLPGAESVDLAPGVVTDVPLGGLAAGQWTVVVDATRPLLAAAVVSRPGTPAEPGGTPPTERAWAASTATGQGGVAVLPRSTRGTLVVGALGTDPAATDGTGTGTLRLLGADGRVLAERPLRVEAGTTGAWALDALLDGSGPVVPGKGTAAGDGPAGPVRAVDLVTDDGASVRLAWALVAEVVRPDGVLVSVLDPVPAQTGVASVTVRDDPRLGTR